MFILNKSYAIISFIFMHGIICCNVISVRQAEVEALKKHSDLIPSKVIQRASKEFITREHLNVQDEHGFTALRRAVEKDDLGAIKTLLESGSDPNIKDFLRGDTALHSAAVRRKSVGGPDLQKHLDILKILLEHGADPTIKNEFGAIPRSAVNDPEAYDMLTPRDKYGRTPVMQAIIKKDSKENIEKLIKQAFLIDLKDNLGSSALHWAVIYKNIDAVKNLLGKEANPNLPNKKGITPLHLASKKENVEIVQELLKHGADPNLKNKEGDTSLYIASKKENVGIVQELLKHGAVPVSNFKVDEQLISYFDRDSDFGVFSPDSKYIVVINDNVGSLSILNTKGEKVAGPFASNVINFKISPDSKHIVTVSESTWKGFNIWEMIGKTMSIWNMNGKRVGGPFEVADVKEIEISPSGQYIVVSDVNNNINIWNMNGKKLLVPFLNNIQEFKISSDDQYIVMLDNSENLSISEMKGRVVTGPFVGNVKQFEITPDGKHIVANISYYMNNRLEIFDMNGAVVTGPFANNVEAFKISPNGKHIIILDKNRDLNIWSINGKRMTNSFARNVKQFEIRSNGNIIVKFDNRRDASIFNSSGLFLRNQDDDWMKSFSPDGQYVIINQNDGPRSLNRITRVL